MEAEREVVDIYRSYFMRDRIGDVFEGTISGVMGFGIFVVIDQPFIEGLVRVEALSDDYYLFDEVTARLVGRRTGRTFALGDTVKVEVQSISVVRRKIDLALHEHGERQRRRAAGRGPAAGAHPPGARDEARRGRRPERAAGKQQPAEARRGRSRAEKKSRAGGGGSGGKHPSRKGRPRR